METGRYKEVDVKAKIISPDDVEIPFFEFEGLLMEHYRKFPRTAALAENPNYYKALNNPFLYFYLVPFALFNLKLNTILSQRWRDYIKLWIYIAIMFIPTAVLVCLPFRGISQTVETQTKWVVTDVGMSVALPLLIGILLSLFYLKYTHDGFLGLTIEKRVEWLEKPVREYYNKFYDRKLPLNPIIILLSLGGGIGFNIPMILHAYAEGFSIAGTFGIISCILSPILYYIFIVATYFLILNTRIYSRILKTMKEKIVIYLEEYGTLLARENYDIIWALGDRWSRGRAIRQIENIPIAGILSSLVVTIAMLMGAIDELIYGIKGTMPSIADVGLSFGTLIDSSNPFTVVVVIIALLVALILFLIVFLPLVSFRSKIKKFKIKALIELDNYIFANVVEFEVKYAEEARQENVTMFQLREYIASMRTLPISTSKVFRIIIAVVLWFLNLRKIFNALAGVQ
ncbi:MAG: hypothetical protein ACXABK_03305 [Candidatus Heimdallarchaeaceae archaeon]|jgi:hypothetical protein